MNLRQISHFFCIVPPRLLQVDLSYDSLISLSNHLRRLYIKPTENTRTDAMKIQRVGRKFACLLFKLNLNLHAPPLIGIFRFLQVSTIKISILPFSSARIQNYIDSLKMNQNIIPREIPYGLPLQMFT